MSSSARLLAATVLPATVVHSQKRQEVEGLTKGRDAVGAAARRTEASAEVLAIAEQWLLKSAASILARRAIEIHRSKVQDPMIARASNVRNGSLADIDLYG